MKPGLMVDGRRRIGTLPVENTRSILRSRTEKISSMLSKEDEKVYGDRCPSGFRKLKLLGRGGCAIVWLGEDYLTGEQVALKQVSRHSGPGAVESCKREIFFGKLLKEIQHPAMSSIATLVSSKIEKNDLWAIFEVGGSSLSKALFQMKGEFVKGERMYNIQHQPLYLRLKSNLEVLRHYLKELLEVIGLFSEINIVHSDLKPDNILVDEENNTIKLVDFGSAYSFLGNGSIMTATPEYMPPEALLLTHSPGDHIAHLAGTTHPWSFDIWSVGMIFLEIITGAPLWMPLKSRVNKMGRTVTCKGLLGAAGRNPQVIMKLQHEITRDVYATVKRHRAFSTDPEMVDLLQRMLEWDPLMRISPAEALLHPFMSRHH